MIALRPVDGPTLFPPLHAIALAVWVAALCARLAGGGGSRLRVVEAARFPAAALALFAAIALFHRHPEHWFSVVGKLRAAVVLLVLTLDAVTEPALARWAAAVSATGPLPRPRLAFALTAAVAAATQLSFTWVSPWPT